MIDHSPTRPPASTGVPTAMPNGSAPAPGLTAERVAVVTGGASGIGRATVLRLASEGVRTVVADLQREAAIAVAAEATALWPGPPVSATGLGRPSEHGSVSQATTWPVSVARVCDVSEEQDIARLVKFVVRTFGRLDWLVNSAGTGGAIGKLIHTRTEDWDRTFAILLRSAFLTTKYAAKAMIEGGRGGAIVNVSSVTAHYGGAAGAAYACAKSGVLALTRCAATQLAEHRIRVNAVLPGTIITPLLYRTGRPEDILDAAVASQPWPEPGLPEHVADVIAFLVSDRSRFMTGAELAVDGGTFASGPNLYGGDHPLGQAMVDRMVAAGVTHFDFGSAVAPNQPVTPPPVPLPPASPKSSQGPESNQAAVSLPFVANRQEPTVAMSPHSRFETSAIDEREGRAGIDGPRRLVLLTGVSRGLGRALALRLAELGHHVVGCARSETAVADLARTCAGPHRFAVVDVADDASVGAWIGGLIADGLVPDLVLNNAAAMHPGRPLWRFDAAEIATVLGVNVAGPINVIRHVLPAMLRRKSGLVVNFSSGWGREAAARTGPYCASKFAIEGLTKSLALELPPGVGAVSLHPGIIRTEGMEKTFGQAATLYPTAEQWAVVAAPYLLSLTSEENGQALAVPGMTTFRGLGTVIPA